MNVDIFSFQKNYNGYDVKVYFYTGKYHCEIEGEYIDSLILDEKPTTCKVDKFGYNYYICFDQNPKIDCLLEDKAEEFWDELNREFSIFWFGNRHFRDDIRRTCGSTNEDVHGWINSLITELMNEEDYSDNARYCLVGNVIANAEYDKRANNGCCGSYDEIHHCPYDGNDYMIGFNFGH